ncbi:hypothetical protein INR49_011019 [Caranx melampygus]|nr:hypothetical protein INR49_011019 [Caranx melampygus]
MCVISTEPRGVTLRYFRFPQSTTTPREMLRKRKEYQPHRWSGRREGSGGERWVGGVGMC